MFVPDVSVLVGKERYKYLFYSLSMMAIAMVACGAPTAEPTPIPPTATLQPPTATPRPRGRTEDGQITSQALAGNLIGDPSKRRFSIYLPPGYETGNDRYPVVFALHAWRGDHEELYRMGPRLNALIEEGEARPMIIVYPDASNLFWGSWYGSSPTIGDYETYITSELVDYVDANYRTLPDRESRGITGCSMGGDGAIHLAFKYPDIFSVAAPVSGLYDYDYESDTWWGKARAAFEGQPDDLDLRGVSWPLVWFMGGAAVAAPNPEKPPFYLDMPFEIVDGEGQIVPEVYEKIIVLAPKNEVHDYLDQPIRLRGLLLVHEQRDVPEEIAVGRAFHKTLTDLGVEHGYLELDAEHCAETSYVPVPKFMSDQLAF